MPADAGQGGARLPRTQGAFGTAEDVFGVDARWPTCHCATVVALPDLGGQERLVAAWYAGTAECRPDVAVLSATWSEQDGWSGARVLVDTAGHAEGNPLLGVSPSGVLWLFFVTLDEPKWRSARLKRMCSLDGGLSWSEPSGLRGAEIGWVVRNKPIRLGAVWLLPAYDEIRWESFVLRSDDAGRSWTPGGRIVAPNGCIQPTLMPTADGLTALLRCGAPGGSVWRSWSRDNGWTWSDPEETPVHNPNSGCDGVVRADASWALACNDEPRGRGVLALRTSRDAGTTWPGRGVLAQGSGEYSYPAVIAAASGGLHVLYTHERTSIRHLRVRQDWLA